MGTILEVETVLDKPTPKSCGAGPGIPMKVPSPRPSSSPYLWLHPYHDRGLAYLHVRPQLVSAVSAPAPCTATAGLGLCTLAHGLVCSALRGTTGQRIPGFQVPRICFQEEDDASSERVCPLGLRDSSPHREGTAGGEPAHNMESAPGLRAPP